ncbi:hypothetical protein M6B38_321860 [Iris pallida]|uniref:Uncharacterized protein n=1 Tax=Iris pallida TaxID=29817 RepID=A0AAX6HC58_IRIPA|nr:hypothetical protein M6B38_321860 [Iris pallida]
MPDQWCVSRCDYVRGTVHSIHSIAVFMCA